MPRLIRLLAILALLFAPLTHVAPAAAHPAVPMADCHHAAPAKSDCCGDSGAHLCCAAAFVVLPALPLPTPASFGTAAWPDFAVRAATIASPPIDQPPRA